MNITAGLFDHMVLQRTPRGVSDAAFSGTCDARGDLLARVTRGGRPLKGLNWVKVGQARRGKLSGRLAGIPAGGPYLVELRIGDGPALKVKDVLVGDVWIAAGQSNMQGCGWAYQAAKPDPLVRAFYMDDHWGVAKDPIHQLEIAVDFFHNAGQRAAQPARNPKGVGPAVAFAQQMKAYTGVPQGILACAHGGTSMSQWDPALKKEGGKSLYGATCRRLAKNGGKVAGVIWYQGESDANPDAAPLYTQRMKNLIRAFRRGAGDPNLPFAMVQISRVVSVGFPEKDWNSVQDQERKLQGLVRNVACVPAIDLAIDDGIHIGGADQQRLGRRLAQAMQAMRTGRRGGKMPIAFKSVQAVPAPVTGTVDVIVEFDHVQGRLVAGSRPVGFALGDPKPGPYIYNTELEGNKVILRTMLPLGAVGDKVLHYGWGADPVCNITDLADRSLPVFGPVPVAEITAMTPFATTLRVTDPAPLPPGQEKLHGLACPADLAALPGRVREFPQRFCDLHLELDQFRPQDLVIYFVTRMEVPEPMKLSLCLGYDGPVKAWLDGQEVFHDPEGVNPAWEDKAKVKIAAAPGSHQVVVALGTNKCMAWGIHLRVERTDVPRRLREKGPGAYAMPTLKAE